MSREHLTAAILLSLALGVGYNTPAKAQETVTITSDGKPVAEITYYAAGEKSGAVEYILEETSEYTFSSALQSAINDATRYWTDILAPQSKNAQPWQILVSGHEKYANAYADTATMKLLYNQYNYYIAPYLAQAFQTGLTLERVDTATDASKLTTGTNPVAVSYVGVGDNFGAIGKSGAANRGWYVNNDIQLPANEQEADLVGCFRHELGHALGIIAYTTQISQDELEAEGYTNLADYLETCDSQVHSFLNNSELWTNSWNTHLYDQNGNQAQAGQLILTSEMLKYLPASYDKNNVFVLDDTRNLTTEELAAKRQVQPTYGYAFFKGDNVSQVLDGKTFQGVDGVPVNGREKGSPEISHIQLPVLMSHRYYCNYSAFTEVELAAMQDLGYQFDRRAYFGRSVYNDGKTIYNTQGYSARNSDGTAYLPGVYSNVNLGLGLHVYGSHNNIYQLGDILTKGTGAVGVRVDGVGNALTVDQNTQIHADGKNGVGIMVSYGKDHVINQQGTVTALGENGNAVQFDFGSSSNGALDEYRGSYIRYKRYPDTNTGNICLASNYPSLHMDDVNTYNSEPDELNGAMVTDFNVSGKIAGNENAIYIGKNAFVQNINLLNGAQISGNITNDWKHFSEAEGIYATE